MSGSFIDITTSLKRGNIEEVSKKKENFFHGKKIPNSISFSPFNFLSLPQRKIPLGHHAHTHTHTRPHLHQKVFTRKDGETKMSHLYWKSKRVSRDVSKKFYPAQKRHIFFLLCILKAKTQEQEYVLSYACLATCPKL